MIVLGTVLALMIWRGIIDSRMWIIVALAFPFSVIGTQTGIFVFRRLNDRQFQRLLILLILPQALCFWDANSLLICLLHRDYWHFFIIFSQA